MKATVTRSPPSVIRTMKRSGEQQPFGPMARSALRGFANNPTIQRKPHCACDGGCPRCNAATLLQPKLKINDPNDRYEQEADRVAEQVMRMPNHEVVHASHAPMKVQRKCATCVSGHGLGSERENEEKASVQRGSNESAPGNSAPRIVDEVLSSPGQALDPATRAFMEPRFGHDLSQVRLHTDPHDARSAQMINAIAFAAGNHIVFGTNQYQPHTATGRHLLAHELTHVLQQKESASCVNTIRRTVRANSRCPANIHNAPADPIAALQNLDALAQRMALGCSHLLFVESLTFDDPTFGRSEVFNAYRDWFGTPDVTPSGQWRSRFRTATFATEEDAMAHEMRVLSERFERLHHWLSGQIRYVCPGTSTYTIPGCRSTRCTHGAESCPGSRTIGICPSFWVGSTDGGRASLLIHEAIHALFRFRGHPESTTGERGRNPYCYQGFVDTIYATGVRPVHCRTFPTP